MTDREGITSLAALRLLSELEIPDQRGGTFRLESAVLVTLAEALTVWVEREVERRLEELAQRNGQPPQ